jgi:uncharacterized protein
MSEPEPLAPAAPGIMADRLRVAEGVRWFLLALAGFVVGEILSTASVALTASVLGRSSEVAQLARAASPPEWFVVSSLIGLWVGFIGAPLLATRLGPVRHRLGLSFAPIDLVGIPIGVVGQFVVVLLYAPFISHLHNFDAPVKKLTGGSHGGGFLLIGLLTIFVAPLAEELFFRGLVLRSLFGLGSGATSRGGKRAAMIAAVVVDGLLFGLVHGELAQLAGLTLFGMLLALLVVRTGRLGMSIIAHASFNAVAIVSLIASGSAVIWH